METRKIFAYILFSLAVLPIGGVVAASLGGDPKGFGSFVFVGFFLAMAGWIVGDF